MKQPLKDMFKKIGGMKLNEYEDEDDTMPLVRAINTLEAELGRTKHKKIQEWGKKYHRSRKGLIKQIENLTRIARKMR
jgi:Holliday junction resolvasome RuvABC ATP-dependent DNA helicase subunit